jgi:hypothetical protein
VRQIAPASRAVGPQFCNVARVQTNFVSAIKKLRTNYCNRQAEPALQLIGRASLVIHSVRFSTVMFPCLNVEGAIVCEGMQRRIVDDCLTGDVIGVYQKLRRWYRKQEDKCRGRTNIEFVPV